MAITDNAVQSALLSNSLLVVNTLYNCWSVFLFVAAMDVPSIFPVLHKARIDNMKDYIEKKRLRLSERRKPKAEMPSTDVDTELV